ncbi:hypothetical protein TVAG_074520 [Trichomonas vaginalis G3]|uniref:Uncharacterized protein n=1 Tax=Trichomonas vaginalis (strain ATCC PRA-98 / G3) TaxID=412133 RepID=A2E3W9_TRIV3|nr:hypothetical protein TVAGG3_0146900 [Trichomonas vaginalis G3]EAY12624.1 hypothetical protein TVAG_074520 [Trichomonas vaginalis G3]KAI5546985.1 hypothetical protein TVAGG3_0146900 [Trichomonas vaginalis G3]|eukprot:XP_001324847.1 hypothetical protein [Trichomonas vaginalis G3]
MTVYSSDSTPEKEQKKPKQDENEFLAKYAHDSVLNEIESASTQEKSNSVLSDSDDSGSSFLIKYLKNKVNIQ